MTTLPLAQRTTIVPPHVAFFRRGLFWLPLALIVIGLIVMQAPRAPAAADATTLVNDMVGQALGMLNDKQISERERAAKFGVLLERNFDIPRIVHFVLGPYWDSASVDERQTFKRLFEQWVVANYTEGFRNYDGETIRITGSRIAGPRTIIVSSEIVDRDGDAGAKLDWVVHHDDGTLKIININVEGVSLVMTQRDQIVSVIEHSGGTVKGANDALQEKLGAVGASQASN